jgi:hypothetical protein
MPCPLFPPEVFVLVGITVFVALSLLTSLFDCSFPAVVPYVYQIAALAGFGQIWMSYAFFCFFVEPRFWCSLLYLVVALCNIIAVNVYIAIKKKLLSGAVAFLGTVTVPAFFISFLSVSAYFNGLAIWMPPLPIVPMESLYAVLVICTLILGFSVIVSVHPETLGKAFDVHLKRQPILRPLNSALDPEGVSKTNEKEVVKEVKNE